MNLLSHRLFVVIFKVFPNCASHLDCFLIDNFIKNVISDKRYNHEDAFRAWFIILYYLYKITGREIIHPDARQKQISTSHYFQPEKRSRWVRCRVLTGLEAFVSLRILTTTLTWWQITMLTSQRITILTWRRITTLTWRQTTSQSIPPRHRGESERSRDPKTIRQETIRFGFTL